jgi:4-hydroxybenzoate polyprenyltransferase
MNLLIILVTFFLMHSLLELELFSKASAVSSSLFHFRILAISIALLAAAGNVLNDMEDVKADALNRPHRNPVERLLSRSQAGWTYWILNFIGLSSGFYILLEMGKPILFSVHLGIALSLWAYSKYLQKLPWLGNFTVAFLCGFIPLLSLWYGIPEIKGGEVLDIIAYYSGLAFMITLLREVVKDLEDLKGDGHAGYRTAPIVLGIPKTKSILYILFGLTLILEIMMLFFIWSLVHKILATLLFGLCLLVPLLLSLISLKGAQTSSDFGRVSGWLKWTLLFGLGSSIIFHFL